MLWCESVVHVANKVAPRCISGGQRPVRSLGTNGKSAAVKINQHRVRSRSMRLQDIKAQYLATMARIFDVFNQPAGTHALLHARHEVHQTGQCMNAGIQRDAAGQLTRGSHVQPGTHASSPMQGLKGKS